MGYSPWARTESDMTEATWRAHGPWEAGSEGAWGRRGQESAVKPEQGLLPGLTTLFPWQPEVPPLRGGGERASAAQQLSGRGHQQVRRGHQVRMATLPSSVWGAMVDRPVGLTVTGILLPTSQVKQCSGGWLRAGRGLQDHHASLLP